MTAFAALVGLTFYLPRTDAEEHTVNDHDGAVVKDDDMQNASGYDQTQAQSITPDGTDIVIQTVTFKPPAPWEFMKLSGNLYYEALAVGGVVPEPIKNGPSLIQVAWTVAEMPSADSWPLWIEGNMKKPGGGGGGGSVPLAHWGAEVNAGTPAGISVDADKDEVILGEDLIITYTVSVTHAGQAYESVDVQILTPDDQVVAEWTDQPGTAGDHDLTWEDAKWTTATHSGKYANPNNGTYTIRATGYKIGDGSGGSSGSGGTDTAEESLTTKLVIEADVTDKIPADAEDGAVAAGLDQLADALEVQAIMGGTTVTVPPAGLTLADIPDGKAITADHESLNTLDDGTWTIRLKDLRDDIGNFHDTDDSNSSVDHYEWDIELY